MGIELFLFFSFFFLLSSPPLFFLFLASNIYLFLFYTFDEGLYTLHYPSRSGFVLNGLKWETRRVIKRICRPKTSYKISPPPPESC